MDLDNVSSSSQESVIYERKMTQDKVTIQVRVPWYTIATHLIDCSESGKIEFLHFRESLFPPLSPRHDADTPHGHSTYLVVIS